MSCFPSLPLTLPLLLAAKAKEADEGVVTVKLPYCYNVASPRISINDNDLVYAADYHDVDSRHRIVPASITVLGDAAVYFISSGSGTLTGAENTKTEKTFGKIKEAIKYLIDIATALSGGQFAITTFSSGALALSTRVVSRSNVVISVSEVYPYEKVLDKDSIIVEVVEKSETIHLESRYIVELWLAINNPKSGDTVNFTAKIEKDVSAPGIDIAGNYGTAKLALDLDMLQRIVENRIHIVVESFERESTRAAKDMDAAYFYERVVRLLELVRDIVSFAVLINDARRGSRN